MAVGTIAGRADGIVNSAYGSGTAAGAIVTIALGFNPTRFVLVNETDAIRFEKIAGMTAANCIKTVTAGTQTVDTGSLILFNGDGTVSIAAAVAINAKVIAWCASL